MQLCSVCHDAELPEHAMSHIELMTRQRLNRMPVQYIIGEWDFHNITVNLSSPVFIPRPETEVSFYLLEVTYAALYILLCYGSVLYGLASVCLTASSKGLFQNG